MLALQQLPEMPNLAELPTALIDDMQDFRDEQSLAKVDNNLVPLEQGIEIIEMYANWLLELDLTDSLEAPLSELQVAHLIAGVKGMPAVRRDIAFIVGYWNRMVDRKGNWRGPESFSESNIKRLKGLNTRTRKLGNRVEKWGRSFNERDLVAHLLVQVAKQRDLTKDEKIQLLHTIPDHRPIDNPISMRRADWYGDDD